MTRLKPNLLQTKTNRTYSLIHTHTAYIDFCRMTGPGYAVMCNLINTRYTHAQVTTQSICIAWRDAREDRFRKHQKYNAEVYTWVSLGPCLARWLKVLKANHVWAAGGSRALERRSTSDVLGGWLPENLEAFGAILRKGKIRTRVAFAFAV